MPFEYNIFIATVIYIVLWKVNYKARRKPKSNNKSQIKPTQRLDTHYSASKYRSLNAEPLCLPFWPRQKRKRFKYRYIFVENLKFPLHNVHIMLYNITV